MAEYDFYVPTNGTYNLWVSGCGTNSGTDSIYVSVDDSARFSCAIPAVSSGTFLWRKLTEWGNSTPLGFELAAGHHTLLLSCREYNFRLDRIVIAGDKEVIDL